MFATITTVNIFRGSSRLPANWLVARIIVVALLSLVTCHLFLVTSTLAADNPASGSEFTTSYDVIYDIDAGGTTTVTEKINLRNLTSEYFANQFKLIIGATQVSDVKAFDSGGAAQVQSEQKGTSTTITVKLNQQVVGLGKQSSWTLQFKSKDFAQNLGKVWEVRAPKVSSEANLEGYNLTISVPLSFGEPTLISPTPKTQTTSSGKMFLTFEKSQLTSSGVSASFGTHQLFDFDLSYHLENPNLVPVITNIALPPDTAFQDIIFQRIDPAPLNVTVDNDGNYLAWYRLNRGQKLEVKAIGSAKLYTQSKVKDPTLSADLRKIYTQSNKYWEKENPQIQQKLTEILGVNPSQSPSEKVRLIYRYVVSSLKYDPGRLKDNIERLGALTALNNPSQAVCMEFTDLFIALARAAGIPSRELDGFAYTANTTLRPLSLSKDILHSWPEFWDEKKGWVMVDPTWENTTGGVDYFNKLDLNHFVFAIKGTSSGQPPPAGSYKYIGQDSHDVKVSLSDNDFLVKPQLEVKIDNADPILAGFPEKIKVKVSNVGSGVYPGASFSINSNKLIFLGSKAEALGPIPAFGSASFDFNVRTKSLFDSFSDTAVVLIGSQKFSKDVEIKPFLIFQTIPLMAVGIISVIGLIYLAVLGGLIYRRRFLKQGK